MTQLIIKEKAAAAGTLKTQSALADGAAARTDVATVQRWSAAAHLPISYKRPLSGGAHMVTLPTAMTLQDAQTIAQRMAASGGLEYVSPDRIMRPMALPADPLFGQRWNLMPPSAGTVGAANAPVTLTAVGGAGYGKTANSPVWAQTAGSPVTLTTSGPDANGFTTATFTPTVAGVYTFSVTLTNSATASDSASVTVTAAPSSGTGTGATASTNNSGGGGGNMPLWLAGLLLTGGAVGFRRRKTAASQPA